ncbi:MAG: hypothetical protein IT581_15545 [Verrucomicrobiales bacterium]|nr:hypothetical protein [Verrucomicrobiales bacterium]
MQPSLPKLMPNPGRSWAECDVFCITGYAGVGVPCGWRGRFHEAAWDEERHVRCCPRCGGASLMGVPQEAVEEPPEGQESYLPHQSRDS